MTIKETIKSLIAVKQEEIPVSYNSREVELPTDSKKIITAVGAGRLNIKNILCPSGNTVSLRASLRTATWRKT